MARLKQRYGAPMFCFGPHASTAPAESMARAPRRGRHVRRRAGRRRRSQLAALESLDRLGDVAEPDLAPGRRPSSRTARTARSPASCTMPYPAWDLRRRCSATRCRWSTSRTCIVETSRGCPYSCDFCVAPIHQGHKFRERSAKALVDEIERSYRELGIEFFYLWGDTVTLNVKSFTRVLRRADRAQPADPVVRQRARRQPDRPGVRAPAASAPAAGCWRWASRPSPKRSARTWSSGSSAQKIQAAFNNMRDAGIRSFAFFIFGYPGETLGDASTTTTRLRDRARSRTSPTSTRRCPIRAPRSTTSVVRDGLLRGGDADWSKMEYSVLPAARQRPRRARRDGRDQPRQAPLLPAARLHLAPRSATSRGWR